MAVVITGTIRFSDGTESEFSISEGIGYHQWGTTQDRIGRSQPIVDAMANALYAEELFHIDEEEH